MKWGIWNASWEVECNSFALLSGSGNCCQRLQRTSVQRFYRLSREKSKGKTMDLTDPGTLYSLARAISNTIIFALLKKVGGVSSSMSAKALNAVALIASGCLTSSHTASKNDLRACLEKFLNALSWQTRGFWQKTLSLFHPLPTAIILLLDYRNNR